MWVGTLSHCLHCKLRRLLYCADSDCTAVCIIIRTHSKALRRNCTFKWYVLQNETSNHVSGMKTSVKCHLTEAFVKFLQVILLCISILSSSSYSGGMQPSYGSGSFHGRSRSTVDHICFGGPKMYPPLILRMP